MPRRPNGSITCRHLSKPPRSRGSMRWSKSWTSRPLARRSGDRGEQLLARLLAAPALLGADPAVLHPVRGVDLALVCATAARLDARSEDRAGDLRVIAGPAADDAPRRRTDVGA